MTLHVLNLRFDREGQPQMIHPVILQHEKELVLVDCGYPGFLPLLEDAAKQQNISLTNLTGVIITHHDIDHMGALFELKEAYPQVKVYASKDDAPYVDGREKSLRLQQAEAMFSSLPDEQKDWALQFQERLKTIRPVKVDATLQDGEELSFLPGVKVIATPGHMPGHISLYLQHEKTLVAADAVVAENGVLNLANPLFTIDMKAAVDTVRKFRQMEIASLVCFHGGVVSHNIQQGLAQIIEQYDSLQQNLPA